MSVLSGQSFVSSEDDELDTKNLHLISGYASSKFVAEKMIKNASKILNISSTVFRPGMISAHRISGYSNVDDW